MARSSDPTGGNHSDFDTTSSWRIFRIMSEFVSGFEFLSGYHRASVTFFGSARLAPHTPTTRRRYALGRRLATAGYTIVTGGGPGIMQAGNQGAYEADGISVGLNISCLTSSGPIRSCASRTAFTTSSAAK